MSKISDAAYRYMKQKKLISISSDDLWKALRHVEPERTAVTEARKTPRATAMRDVRVDARFESSRGVVTLKEADADQ